MKKGFTLIEMLVVIGIIAVLIGASIAGYNGVTKSAEKARAQELVSNAATALTAYFQREGSWPPIIRTTGESGGLLDEKRALVLAKKGLFSLTTQNGQLAGLDRFGIVTPWAQAAIRQAGSGASSSTKVGGTSVTVHQHILHFAVDVDGDGIIDGADVGGESVRIRATAAVWCIGKSGGNKGEPWPYATGRKRDDVYSWTYGQTQDVK